MACSRKLYQANAAKNSKRILCNAWRHTDIHKLRSVSAMFIKWEFFSSNYDFVLCDGEVNDIRIPAKLIFSLNRLSDSL